MPPTGDRPDDSDVTTGETAGSEAGNGDAGAKAGSASGSDATADTPSEATPEAPSAAGDDPDGTGDDAAGEATLDAPSAARDDPDGAGDGAEAGGTTLAERRQRAAAASAGQGVDWGRTAKRYGPFVAVAVLIAGAIAVFGGGGGGDDDGGSGGGEITVPSEEELIRSGPMTPQRAELEGRDDVDFGPNCDTTTGRIMLPTVYAAPCVEPFEGDNGGATSMGVTADEVLIVRYTANADAAAGSQSLSAAINAGLDPNPETMAQALDNYTRLYNEVFETYGRTVRVEEFTGTGAGDDREAARADAIAIADMEPFAVVGGPWEAGDVFATELAARGVVCGPACTLSEPDSVLEEYFPYLWLPGPTVDQGAQLFAEVVSKLAGPGPAALAGDPEMQQQDRRYALLHYDTPEGDFAEAFESTRDALSEAGVELTTDVEYELDLANAQEDARTVISGLKDQGITTILFTGEPLTPISLTEEATAQDYHPEWILGPTVFGDYSGVARLLDGEQWSHGFGLSWSPARVGPLTGDAATIYRWAFGEDTPNRLALLSEGTLRWVFEGIHLAGPELTPETFRDAIFRGPPGGGGPTAPQVSVGDHGIWPGVDLGSVDDLTLLWWDPDATGVDEVDRQGQGMYRYAKGGARYRLGQVPDSPEEAGLFDEGSSILLYDQRPPEDVPSTDYPPPDLE